MSMKINDRVTWVGKIDWELKKFHGEEYSTHRGSSYNSYLVQDEKTALIDTVWMPYAKEYVAALKKTIDLSKIDFIVANHAEVDHSGALPELMKEIPDTPIYCTKNGIRSLKGHYHQDWNFVEVKTGDKISLGSRELVFIEARMLHWPDSMFVYLTEDHILFSNDAFGQHYAAESLYNDTVNQAELFQEAIKYYANILTPFSPLVKKKIDEVLSFSLPVEMICPSHGVIWRDNPVQIVEQYMQWADAYQEDQVTLVYDSMWRGTSRMAEGIAAGLKKSMPGTTIKLLHAGLTDKNDIITELFKSKAFLIGSSTINQGILSSIAAVMEMVKGLKFKNKQSAAFGSYGWSGESVPLIEKLIKESGIELAAPGLKVLWNPDEAAMAQCIAFGEDLGSKL